MAESSVGTREHAERIPKSRPIIRRVSNAHLLGECDVLDENVNL
jgi:hypothetical protein